MTDGIAAAETTAEFQDRQQKQAVAVEELTQEQKDAAFHQAALQADAEQRKADAAKAAEGIGDIVIVIGRKGAASGSEEDPAIVNLATQAPVLPPKPTVIVDGVPQPKPVFVKPEEIVCYVAATLFPQGMAPQNIRNVPVYADRAAAVAARGDNPAPFTAANPDAGLVAYPKP